MSRLQVVSWAPGSGLTNPKFLGQYGHVGALKFSYSLPGGADQLSCTLARDARFRNSALNPGRVIQVVCGASVVWEGILAEPAPSTAGWNLTAVGNGAWGTNYRAVYTLPWANTSVDDAVNQAIVRGLRWVNPGVGVLGNGWYGQATDSGAQTITQMLNLVMSNGGYTWLVGRGNILTVLTLGTNGIPASPVGFRLLTNPNPVARTLGGNINTIYERYETAADAGTVPATFALTSSQDAASVAQFGTQTEDYIDLSSAGVLSAGSAQQVGTLILERYQRASYAGPFTVRQGQLLTAGGQPVDLAQEQAGTVVRMLMTDYAYGAEEVPAPVQFLVGNYAYDDDSQTAQITPFQNMNLSEQSVKVEPWVTAPPFPLA